MFKENTMLNIFNRDKTEKLRKWMRSQYDSSIQDYNESDKFDPRARLLLDMNLIHDGIMRDEEMRHSCSLSKDVYDATAKKVYRELYDDYFAGYC